MSIGIKPLGARVVIKRSEALEKTEGGLILRQVLRRNHKRLKFSQ